MLQQVKRWLAPPVFPDDEIKTRRANLLNSALINIATLVPVFIIGNLLGGRTPLPVFGANVLAWASYLVLRRWMYRGKVRLASIGLLMMGLVLVTASAASLGTIRTPTTTLYLLLIIMGGLFFDWRGVVITTALCALTIGGLIGAENAGLLPRPDYAVTITQWVAYVAIFSWTGSLTFVALRMMRQALGRADQEIAERKRAEEALREAEQKYRSIFENAVNGIFQSTPEGRFIDANPALARMWGYASPEELLASITDIAQQVYVDPARRAEFMRLMQEEGRVSGFDFQVRRKDGNVIWISENVRGVRAASGKMLYYEGTAEDITARKQAEAALRQSSQFNREIISNATEGIIVYDRAFRYVVWNRFMENLTGMQAADVLGKCAFDIFPHLRQQGVDRLLERALRGETVSSPDTRYYVPQTGRAGWVSGTYGPHRDTSGSIIGVIGMVRDITEHKQMEDAERAQRARAEALGRTAARLNAQLDLDAVLNAVCEETAHALNVPATSVTLYDEKRAEFDHAATFGMPPAYRARAKPFPRPLFDRYAAQMSSIIIGPDVQAVPELPNADLYRELAIRTIVGATMWRDGQLIGGLNLFTFHQVRHFADDELALLKGLADQAALAIANARLHGEVQRHAAELEQKVAERTAELTQREAALRIANERLQQLNRLKSEFVSNVSHELRTPLTNIISYLYLLEKGRPEKRAKYMATLHRESALLHRLIEDLLHLSRLDLGQVQPAWEAVDVNRMVELLAGDRRQMFEDRGLTLELQVEPNLPPIRADERMLIQVLTNLMTNAMHYTPRGGVVTVETGDWGLGIAADAQSPIPNPQSLIPGTQPPTSGAWVTFGVADTGPGIPPEEQAHLFERFFRGEAARQANAPGTGLGLAISRELIERHGGRLTVESHVGVGSTFTVWLPVDRP